MSCRCCLAAAVLAGLTAACPPPPCNDAGLASINTDAPITGEPSATISIYAETRIVLDASIDGRSETLDATLPPLSDSFDLFLPPEGTAVTVAVWQTGEVLESPTSTARSFFTVLFESEFLVSVQLASESSGGTAFRVANPDEGARCFLPSGDLVYPAEILVEGDPEIPSIKLGRSETVNLNGRTYVAHVSNAAMWDCDSGTCGRGQVIVRRLAE